MLKKAIMLLCVFFISSMAFVLNVEADEINSAECKYSSDNSLGEFTIVLAGGKTSVQAKDATSLTLVNKTLQEDFDKAEGCPETLYHTLGVGTQEVTFKYIYTSQTVQLGYDGNGIINGKQTGDSAVPDNPVIDPPPSTVDPNHPQQPSTQPSTSGGKSSTQPIPPGTKIECADFGGGFFEDLYMILVIVGPILLVIFGGIDFLKAVTSGDEKALHKAGTDFLKRAIATIILLLLPLILTIIFRVATNADIFTGVPDNCVQK